MARSKDIRTTIQNLLNLANNKGASQAEAQAALLKAKELMMKYNLEEYLTILFTIQINLSLLKLSGENLILRSLILIMRMSSKELLRSSINVRIRQAKGGKRKLLEPLERAIKAPSRWFEAPFPCRFCPT